MKKITKRSIALMMSALMLAGAMSGCGGSKGYGSGESNLATGMIEYPIETDQKLTYWIPINGVVAQQVTSLNETEFAKKLIEETGIDVEFIHPPQGQEGEKFNVMMASGELPDIVAWGLSGNEGPDEFIKNGYVFEMTEEFMQKYAPNFYKKIQSDPEFKKSVMTSEGRYYAFSKGREDYSLATFSGLYARADWLKELGLEKPQTIDELHDVLVAFRDKKGAKAPLSMSKANLIRGNTLLGAYGVSADFYLDGKTVKYGPMQPGYKEFLKTMAQWYKEGLIDKNVAAINDDEKKAQFLRGETGVAAGTVGADIGSLLTAKKGEKFEVVGLQYPTLKKGDYPEYGHCDYIYYEPTYWISATSKNKELAARLLDYGYSEKGHMLYNFGTEGVTYEMKDGEPVLTDFVTNNPEGKSATYVMSLYAQSTYEGPFIMDKRFFRQQYPFAAQLEALDTWGGTNQKDHVYKGTQRITSEESSEYSTIMTDVISRVDEVSVKIIMGIEPIESYDALIDQIKGLNVERAIEIRQAGYDRYMG